MIDCLLVAQLVATLFLLAVLSRAEWRAGDFLKLLVPLVTATVIAKFPIGGVLPTLAWVSTPFLLAWEKSPKRFEFFFYGTNFYYQLLSSLLFVAASVFDGRYTPELYLLAVWIRLGAFPFHAGAISVATRDGLAIAVPVLLSPAAFLALLRYVEPDAGAMNFVVIRGVTVFGAVYLAGLGLVQTNRRAWLAIVYQATTAIGFFAFFSGAESVRMAVWHWSFCVAAFTGLAVVIWLLDSRVGNAAGGWAGNCPGLASFFLVFALIISGIPGGFSFISEELLLTRAFAVGKVEGSLLVTALGVTLISSYRMFARIFLGNPQPVVEGIDLLRRERFAMALLLLILIAPVFFAGRISRQTIWEHARSKHEMPRTVFTVNRR